MRASSKFTTTSSPEACIGGAKLAMRLKAIRENEEQAAALRGADDAKALDVALRSDARKDAREDFAGFPAFEGEVTHQAMKAEVIF